MSLPILQIKRRNVAPGQDYATGGGPNGLIAGELGYNYYNGTLWIGPNGSTDGKGFSIHVNPNYKLWENPTYTKWIPKKEFGPELKLTMLDATGVGNDHSITISSFPTANTSQSGVVIAGAQTFGGLKTFNDGLAVTGGASITTDGYVISKWLKTTDATDTSTAPSKVAIIQDGWIYWANPNAIVAAGNIAGSGLTWTKKENAGTTGLEGLLNHTDNARAYDYNTNTWAIGSGVARSDTDKQIKFGDAFTIPQLSYNTTGHITDVERTTVTLPAISHENKDTDTTAKFITSIEVSDSGKITSTFYNGDTGDGTDLWYLSKGIPTKSNAYIGEGTKPVFLSGGVFNECAVYAGGTKVSLNGSDKGAQAIEIFAPTTGATAGQYLRSKGTGSAPEWSTAIIVETTAPKTPYTVGHLWLA
jgi:hypothetical protein